MVFIGCAEDTFFVLISAHAATKEINAIDRVGTSQQKHSISRKTNLFVRVFSSLVAFSFFNHASEGC